MVEHHKKPDDKKLGEWLGVPYPVWQMIITMIGGLILASMNVRTQMSLDDHSLKLNAALDEITKTQDKMPTAVAKATVQAQYDSVAPARMEPTEEGAP